MLSPGSHPVGGKPPATRGPGREPRADSARGILQLLKGTKSVTNLYVRKHEKPISVITYSGYLCKHMYCTTAIDGEKMRSGKLVFEENVDRQPPRNGKKVEPETSAYDFVRGTCAHRYFAVAQQEQPVACTVDWRAQSTTIDCVLPQHISVKSVLRHAGVCVCVCVCVTKYGTVLAA